MSVTYIKLTKMEIDRRLMFYSRIYFIDFIDLLTAAEAILVTSTLKHIGEDQYAEARVQPAPPARRIAE